MRQPFLDVLRGIAVVLMIYTHTLNAWLSPAGLRNWWYKISALIFALPSRMFLFLMGASLALRLHAEVKRGASSWKVRREALWRGAELVAFGLLLRFQDWRSHGYAEPLRLWKVDILNCMGAATWFMAIFCLRRDGLPGWGRALLLALLAVVLAPLSAHWPWPAWLPPPVGAYLWGPRPLAYFPLLPWVAFALLGLAFGDLWQRLIAARGEADARARHRVMALTGLGAALVIAAAIALNNHVPVPSPAAVAIEAGPLLFVSSAAAVVLLTALGYFATLRFPGLAAKGTWLTVLGQASLPIYFIHLMISYGKIGDQDTGLGVATLGSLGITMLMIPVGWGWLRIKALRPRRRKAAAATGSA